jgi:two-component system NtrC family sensor kinase
MEILVVDNDQLILEFMSDILSGKGHRVRTAGDGLLALDMLKAHTPDVIFSDLVMPNIDGKRFCKIVRSVPELGDVYLVILTSVAAEAALDIAELNADACIAKGPFKEMGQNVFAVLDQPELSSSRCRSGKVLGIEKVHPRRISMELLSLVKHLENILGRLPEGIFEISSEGKIVYANPAALALTGMAEGRLIGRPFLELFSGQEREKIGNFLQSKEDLTAGKGREAPLALNDCLVTLDILALKQDPSSAVVVMNDVTKRKQTENELEKHRESLEELVDERVAEIKKINKQLKNEILKRRQTEKALLQREKLESVLETATAVCHEMNQPLQVVSGYSNLLLKDMAEDDPHYEEISEMAKQIERMTGVMRNLQNITTYNTRTYTKGRNMIDLDESSK